MEYNKKQFQKANDKKVLHKVKKHWVVMSMALLMAIGGEAIATHVNARADVNSSQSGSDSNVNTVKNSLNQRLVNAASNQKNNEPINSNQGQSTQFSSKQQTPNVSDYMKQASELHRQILRNAIITNPSNSSNGRQTVNENDGNDSSNSPQDSNDNRTQAHRLLGSNATQNVTVNYMYGSKKINNLSGTYPVLVNNNQIAKNELILPENKGYQVAVSDLNNYFTVNNGIVNVPVDRYSRWGGYEQKGPEKMAPWYLDARGNLMIGNGDLSLGTDSWNGTDSDRENVKSIEIIPGATVSAEGISSDFANFPNVQTINVTGLDTSNTSDFNNAFANDPSLTSIMGLNRLKITSDAVSVNGMFASDDSLAYLELPNMSNNKISDFSDMFKNDPKLTTIKGLSDIRTSDATHLSEMFENDDMNYLNLVNFNTRNAQDMSDFVGSDPQLTTITVGSDTKLYNPNAHYTVDNGSADPSQWQQIPYAGPGLTGAWQDNSGNVYNSSDLNDGKKTLPKGTYKKNVVSANLTYVKWFSGKHVHPISGQQGYITPDRPLADDAAQIPDISNYEKGNISDNPNHPIYYDIHKYHVADDGDDDGGNYLSQANVSDVFNKSYQIPVISSKVIGYGYDGTSKYELNDEGDLKIIGGQLAKPLSSCFKSNSDDLEARSVRQISFASNVKAPTNSSNLFAGLPNVESIDLTGLDTTGVTNMSGMLHANDDRTLQTIKGLKDLNTSKVSDMQGMFKNTGIHSVSDIANWNVSNVTNLNSDFQGDIDLSNWNPIYQAWTFNNQPSVVNMLSGSSANNGDDPKPRRHALDNNLWKFTPSLVKKNFNYVDWITGTPVGTQQSASIFPGVYLRSDASEIPSIPGYHLVDHGDDNDSDYNSTNYVSNVNSSDYVDGTVNQTYTVPVVPNNIVHYGYDGPATSDAKYELNNNGTLQFYKGYLSKATKDLGDFASDIRTIQFQPGATMTSDGKAMFGSLPNLTTFNQANLNSSDVADASDMFSHDPSLVTLDLSKLNIGSANDGPRFNNMFRSDSNLRYADLSQLNTSGKTANNMFVGDNNLVALKLGNTDTYMSSDNQSSPTFFIHTVKSDGSKASTNAGNVSPGTYFAASPVAVHFVDQNGTSSNSGETIYVPTYLSSYKYGNGYHGNVINQMQNLIDNDNLHDSDYSIVNLNSPQQDYSIHNSLDNNPYINLKVVGNASDSEVDHGQVQIVYENHDGSTNGQPGNGTPVKLPLTISGHNGDLVYGTPSNWVPKGYYLDINTQKPNLSKTHPSDFVAQIRPDGKFQWVHVTNQTAHTVHSDANGYLPTFYVRAETTTDNPDPNKHQISDPTVTVNQILEAKDGHVVGFNSQQVAVSGDVGNTYTLNNSSDRMQHLDGYTLDTDSKLHADYNQNNGNVTGRIMVNAAGNAYLTNPIENLYYIKRIPSRINVHYINQAGHEVDHFESSDQSDGTTLDLKGNSPFITDSRHQITGYSYDTAKNQAKGISDVTFGDHDQDAYVYVIGKKESVPVRYVYQYQNGGQHYIKTLASDTLSGYTGSEIRIPNSVSSIPSDVYTLANNQNTSYLIPYVASGSDTPTYTVSLNSRWLTVPVQFMHNNEQFGPVNYSTHGNAYNNVILPDAPEGYHYDKASDQKYQIQPTPSDVGNPTNVKNDGQLQTDFVKIDSDLAKVHVNYLDQNNDLITQSDTSGNDHVGHSISFNAPKGYHLAESNNTYTFKPQDAVASATSAPANTVNVYIAGNTNRVTVPVYIQYENYNSDNRGAKQSDSINLNFNGENNNQYTFHPSQLNLINDATHQNIVPQGYQIDYKKGKTSSSDVAKVNSDGGATWINGQPTIYVKADQSKTLAEHNLNVNQIRETSNGQIVGTSHVTKPLSDYNVGDTYNVSDTNSWLQIPHYHLAQGTDPNALVNPANHQLKGQVTASGLTNHNATLYYVADNANNMTVDYKIHGMDGSSDTAVPQPQGSHVYSGYYGQQINGFDHIPSGYHLDTSNTPLNTEFTLGDSQSDKVVYVLPDQVNNRTVNVEAKLEDPQGNQIMNAKGQPVNVSIPVNVDLDARGQFKITPSDNAFHVSPLVNRNDSDGFVPYNNSDITGYITPVGPKITSNNKGTFVFRAKNDSQTTGTITVDFINQNGQFVNHDGTIATDPTQYSGYVEPNGYYDKTINVTKAPGIPTGYQFADNQPSDYTFNGLQQTAMVRIEGNAVKDPVNVKIYKEDPYGRSPQSDVLPKPNPTTNENYDVFYVSGQIGDSYNYSNSDFKPASYSFDYNNSPYSSANVMIMPNGKLQINNHADQNMMEFHYYSNASVNNLGNITVNYEDTDVTTDAQGHKNHNVMKKVIDPSDIKYPYDGKVIPDITHASQSINTMPPKGYNLVPGQNLQTKMSLHPTSVTLMVTPTTSQGKGTNSSDQAQPVEVTYQRIDNNHQIGQPFYIEGNMGQNVNVIEDNQHPIPQGYQLIHSQQLDYQITNSLQHAIVRVMPNQNSTDDYYNNIRVVTPSDKLLRSYRAKSQPVELNQSITIDPTKVSDVTRSDSGQYLSSQNYRFTGDKTPFKVTNNGGYLSVAPKTLTYQARDDNHGKIIVQYYDDDNNDAQLHAGGTINHGYDQEIFTAKQIASDVNDHVNVPNGYSLDSNQTQSYAMNNSQNAPVVAKLYVHGNHAVRGVAHITLNEYDPYNKKLIASPVVSDVINGTVGDNYRIDPQDYVPNGYQLDNPKYANNNHVYSGTLSPDGISDGSKNIQFYYQLPHSDAENLQPITVQYVDGGYHVATDTINPKANVDYAGEKVSDVTKASDAKVPKNYIVSPTNQVVSTTFGHTPRYMTINVRTSTNKSSGKFMIVNNLYNHNHTKLVQTETKVLSLKGVIGTNSDVGPAQFIAPTGYQNPTNPHVVKVAFTPSGLSQSSTSYDYDSDAIQPINVSYISQGVRVGHVSINSRNGQPLYMNEPVDAAQDIPAGYQLSSGQDPLRNASSKAQNVNLNVEPAKDTSKIFDVTIVRRDPNGNSIAPNFIVPVRIDTAIGSTEKVTTSNLEQVAASDVKQILPQQLAGFVPSHHNGSDVTVKNDNAKVNPTSDTFYYTASQDVQPINVVYYNQHGQDVGSGQITTGYVDKVVPDVTSDVKLPKGYQLMPNLQQQTRYVFSQHPQTANLMVTGKTESDTVKVHIYENGNPSNVLTSHVHGNVGDNATLDARNFIPKGYIVANDGQPDKVQIAINNGNVNPTNVRFDYDTNPTDKVQPIYVTYINQAGKTLIKNHKLQGTYGQNIDIYNATKSDLNDHSDHHALYQLDMPDNNQNYQYTYGGKAQYATIMVTGVPVTNQYHVNRTLIKYLTSNQSDDIPDNQLIHGRIGDLVTITPDEYQPNGYKVDSADQAQSFILGSDHGQIHQMRFTYDRLPISNHMIFEDVNNHHQVGEENITGIVGQTINWNDYRDFVPYGYKFVGDGHQNATIQSDDTTDPNVVYVKSLHDKPAPQPTPHAGYGIVNIHYVDNADHSHMIGTLTLNQPIGQLFRVMNYTGSNSLPNGYQWTPSDVNSTARAMGTPITSFKSQPQQITLYVTKGAQSNPVSQDMIEYRNADNHDQKVGRDRIIVGQTGNQIDYSPYKSNLPSGYSFASLGTHDSVFEPNRTEIVYVHPATNKTQYGSINVVYRDVANHNKQLSDDNLQLGISGSLFNFVSDAVNMIPEGYTFKQISRPVYLFNSGSQTMVIDVQPNQIFSHVNIDYINMNNNQLVDSEKISGKVGDAFSVSPYAMDIPRGYQYDHISNNVPIMFKSNPVTIKIYLKNL